MSSLYDNLQAEFCPPLDSSLLAALIADLDPTSLSQSGSSDQVDALRTTLKELASQATAHHEHELSNEIDSAHLSSLSLTTDESTTDFCGETTETSTTSDSSGTSHYSFSSPLGFLQAALPHIPPSQLKCALRQAGTGDDDNVDMESVVEVLLTSEFIRELEERGLSAIDGDVSQSPLNLHDDLSWKRVEPPLKSTSVNGKATKKKGARGKTISLVDIRQKQHLSSPGPIGPPAPDPWTQLSSLSEHLATLLPPHPATFFQSHFHSPSSSSPAKALRTALSSIVSRQSKSSPDTTATLFAILDIIRDSPVYASLDAEQCYTLYADAQLALRATRGRGDDAIDIVWLLLDLNLDHESGKLSMGVYHFPPTPLSPGRSSAWTSPTSPSSTSRDRSGTTDRAMRQLSGGPPPAQPPPPSKRKSVSSPETSPTTSESFVFQWQTIPQKPPKGPHPLALHIPAYDGINQKRRSAGAGKVRGSGNGMGKGGKGDVGELMRPDLRQRMAASSKKREELLREASRAWSRGNAKTRGGEVALYFAERAREFQELARREALNEARIMVDSKRSTDRDVVDLHGTSISEAIVIVKEILEHENYSAANPLKIITGRGTHSINGVGVLKPAVRNALVRDGWNVGVWDGGLVVRGRNSSPSS